MILYSDGVIDGISNGLLIFLAGPTRRTNGYVETITPWRLRFLELYSHRCDFAIPEPYHVGDWPEYEEQVAWEIRMMNESDKIFFWIPRNFEYPGFTTNVEFGSWYKNPKTYYGRPENAERCRYLDTIWFNHWTRPIMTTIEDFKYCI